MYCESALCISQEGHSCLSHEKFTSVNKILSESKILSKEVLKTCRGICIVPGKHCTCTCAWTWHCTWWAPSVFLLLSSLQRIYAHCSAAKPPTAVSASRTSKWRFFPFWTKLFFCKSRISQLSKCPITKLYLYLLAMTI